MANDADIRELTKAVKMLTRRYHENTRVLVSINSNFVEFTKRFDPKPKKEETNGGSEAEVRSLSDP